MSAAKKEITPSEASEQKGILQDLYKKELFGKYSKTNGFDKAYMIEKVDELFQKYKVNRENMARLETKMEKQFDANYTKHFQMKEVQRISDKKEITKSKRLIVAKGKPGQKSDVQNDEKTKPLSIPAGSQKKSADQQQQQKSSEISEKKSEKVAPSVAGTLSGSQACDLKGLWEKENAKLRAIKLAEQENRRKELDAQENNKKQLKEKEKKEDEEYMRQVRKEERRQVRLDREKAKLREKEMEEEKARIEKQKKEKFQIKVAEADYDNQKHNEMMGILDKENKIEAAKIEEQKREMRKLFRNQIRDMKNQTKKQINEREEEKVDEKERMRVYAEMEEKRQQARQNEVNKREQHAKDVMNAFHQKYGIDIAEKEKEDQSRMFKTIAEQEKKADQEDERRKQLIVKQRGLLKSALERQSQEKIQRDRNWVLNEYAKDEDMLKITRQAIKQDDLLQSNRKQQVKKYASYLDQQMQERRIQSAKKMSSNELEINKPILKGIVVQSQGEQKELNFNPHLKRAVSQNIPFRRVKVLYKGF